MGSAALIASPLFDAALAAALSAAALADAALDAAALAAAALAAASFATTPVATTVAPIFAIATCEPPLLTRAAWANAPKSRSRYGYIVCVYGIPIMWETKVSTMVCLSTAESEFVAAVHAAKSALWLVNLAATLCNVPTPAIAMFEDNQACIKMTVNPVVSSRNRHFAMRMWWLRQKVEEGKILITYIETQKQLADILTKPLPKPLFIQLRDKIMSGVSLLPPMDA